MKVAVSSLLSNLSGRFYPGPEPLPTFYIGSFLLHLFCSSSSLFSDLLLYIRTIMSTDSSAVPTINVEDDAPDPPLSVPESGDAGEGGKLKVIVQLVKKCFGVKDIASM